MPSSVILHTGYNAATLTLRIVFVSGMVYDYLDVPARVYQSMKAAPSKGIYFNLHIKGIYKFRKVE